LDLHIGPKQGEDNLFALPRWSPRLLFLGEKVTLTFYTGLQGKNTGICTNPTDNISPPLLYLLPPPCQSKQVLLLDQSDLVFCFPRLQRSEGRAGSAGSWPTRRTGGYRRTR
jgi:hypothetical protein